MERESSCLHLDAPQFNPYAISTSRVNRRANIRDFHAWISRADDILHKQNDKRGKKHSVWTMSNWKIQLSFSALDFIENIYIHFGVRAHHSAEIQSD